MKVMDKKRTLLDKEKIVGYLQQSMAELFEKEKKADIQAITYDAVESEKNKRDS